ncbi:hypothetical protein WR25_20248 isoform B [Diploscapter pachys]|uniref:Uncharacterized protein n=1 Tax=Diploscapter pachys TaxID=2018661 RepID=A0A2A2LNY2_9BILA|nr:hypothetical protein WR25_20248 isoform B [Diploscapter pachys]
MNQPPPPIGFGTPDSNDPPYEQPVVSNAKAEQMAILDAEARTRRERNEAEYRQQVDRGLQADQNRQLILGTIVRDAEADRAADEKKRMQERAKRDEDRVKQKKEREKDRQEVAQALERAKENAKKERAAFEKTLADDEANSGQRINAQKKETERLVTQQEEMNAENRRKRDEERAAGQAQHDREMAEEQKALAAIREREEDYQRGIRELELEGMGPVPIGNPSIGPPPPVLQSAIAPPPVSSQIHTQTQDNTHTVESAMNQQQSQETRPVRSLGNIKEIMDAIDAIDEMLRKKCKAALEYVCRTFGVMDIMRIFRFRNTTRTLMIEFPGPVLELVIFE